LLHNFSVQQLFLSADAHALFHRTRRATEGRVEPAPAK
jgi:hypothetical protein